jgi:gamma-glutamylputrescine oxidase
LSTHIDFRLKTKGYGRPYWLDVPRPVFGSLDAPATADVAIVGAGIAGLKLSRALARRGLTSIVCELAQVGEGASSRNQGTINHSPNASYADCVRLHSRETARRVWRLGLENQRLLCETIDELSIDCDYSPSGMTFLARRDIALCEERLGAYRRDFELLAADGFAVDWLEERAAREAFSQGIFAGGFRYTTDAQFHSGKFVIGLAQGVARLREVRVCEGVRVTGIERSGSGVRVTTSTCPIEARCVCLATNALAPQFVRSLASALRAERGQVLVTAPLKAPPCTGSFGTALAWWREIREPDGRFRLLFGGGRARDEPDSLFRQFSADGGPHPLLEREGFLHSDAHQARLDEQFARIFPQLASVEVTHRWGGLQSFTADDFPIIGCLDPERSIWGMVGFCGRGNCHSDVGAEYLAGRISNTPGPVGRDYGDLFEALMRPGRPTADWPAWASAYDGQ